MSKRGEVLALGDPSPSAAWWLLASPGAAAMGSWGALLPSELERVRRGSAESIGRAPESGGGGRPAELSWQDSDMIPHRTPRDRSAPSAAVMGFRLE